MGDLTGKTAIVTGGGSGIGLAAAHAFVKDGAWVLVAGRTEEKLQAAVVDLAASAGGGGSAHHIVCDVTVENDVAAAVTHAETERGTVDICVASAGAGMIGPITSLPLEAWQMVIDLNLTGMFLTMKHACGAMSRTGGGSFVAVSSLASSTVHRYMSPYGVSKAGVDALVRYAADEMGPQNVRVNSVLPSYIETDLVAPIRADDGLLADYVENIPSSRLGTVDDTTAAIGFLAGAGSAWVTGETIHVDGGHHLRRGPNYEGLSRAVYGDRAVDGPPPAPER